MRAAVGLLCAVAFVSQLQAQSSPRPDERWFGRLAVGMTWQDPYAYTRAGWLLGGAAGFHFREHVAIRVDVWHAQFDHRTDNVSCSGIGPASWCTGDPRAPDVQREWAASATLEWRLAERGFYCLGGAAGVHRTGIGLENAGLAAGPMVGMGLRLGHVVAIEARFVRLLIGPAREAWSAPLVVTVGP
jgi:hypothetical protein